jgi:putative endonuclease
VVDSRQTFGAAGEDAALRMYRTDGYRLIARNWRCRVGELDLVLARGRTLVVCEVKTRRGDRYGSGWEAVTPRKQAKVRAVTEVFLLGSGTASEVVRFDVASVVVRPGARPERSAVVEIFEDAF